MRQDWRTVQRSRDVQVKVWLTAAERELFQKIAKHHDLTTTDMFLLMLKREVRRLRIEPGCDSNSDSREP